MKPEIKEKITATNQKYLKKFLTEKAPAKLESQLEHMDWSYLDMIHNKEQQRGTFSPLAAMELSEIEVQRKRCFRATRTSARSTRQCTKDSTSSILIKVVNGTLLL